jgi:hypothetical protein
MRIMISNLVQWFIKPLFSKSQLMKISAKCIPKMQ